MNALKDLGKRMIATLIDLATSKKALASAGAVVVGFFVKDPAQRDRIVEAIMAYVISQGIVDHAKARADAALGLATSTVTASTSTPVSPPAAKIAMLLAFVGLTLGASGCTLFQKKVTAIEGDIKACITDGEPQAWKDVKTAAVDFLEKAFVCDAGAGFDPNAIPPCLVASLSAVTAQVDAVGGDGKAFEACVVNRVEHDPAAAEPVKQRARLVKVKLELNR